LRRLLSEQIELRTVEASRLSDALDGDVLVLTLTHVNYRTGAMHDMAALTAAAQRAGALTLWDLSHSAGAMPLTLNTAGVDLAVGGGYKFLNGGPGAPAYLFVAKRWIERIQPALAGWMGHARPFDFDTRYAPAAGIERLLVGTPPVLSLAALDAGIELFEKVDLRLVRAKSIALGELFRHLVTQECGGLGLTLVSPADAEHCGSQVSYAHSDGHAVIQALIERRVIGDFRAPDVMRFGFAPLYVRHVDVFDAVLALRDVLKTRAWDQTRFHLRALVT
jgi:kynureninase